MKELKTSEITPRIVYFLSMFIATFFIANKTLGIVNPVFLKNGYATSMMMLSLACGAIIISMINFKFGTVLFIFITPFVSKTLPGIPFFFTLGDAYLIVLAIIFFIRVISKHEGPMTGTFLDKIIFLLTIATSISIINSRDFNKGLLDIIQTIEFFVVCYYIFSFSIKTRIALESIILAIVCCAVLISTYGIFEYFDHGGGKYRIMGTFGNFNALGAFLAMTTPFIFNLALSEKETFKRIFFNICLSLNFFALILTFSRGAWVAVMVSIILSAQLKGMVNFLKYFLLIFVMIIILSLVIPSSPNEYIDRFSSISKVSDNASLSRLRQYEIAYETILKYPILGVGLGSNIYYVTEVFDDPANSEIHNLFLHIACERGLPTSLILMWLFMTYFIDIMKRIRATEGSYYHSIYLALFSSILSYMIVNFFAYMLIRGPAMYFSIFLGLYQATIIVENHEPKDAEWARLISSIDIRRPTMRMGY